MAGAFGIPPSSEGDFLLPTSWAPSDVDVVLNFSHADGSLVLPPCFSVYSSSAISCGKSLHRCNSFLCTFLVRGLFRSAHCDDDSVPRNSGAPKTPIWKEREKISITKIPGLREFHQILRMAPEDRQGMGRGPHGSSGSHNCLSSHSSPATVGLIWVLKSM